MLSSVYFLRNKVTVQSSEPAVESIFAGKSDFSATKLELVSHSCIYVVERAVCCLAWVLKHSVRTACANVQCQHAIDYYQMVLLLNM